MQKVLTSLRMIASTRRNVGFSLDIIWFPHSSRSQIVRISFCFHLCSVFLHLLWFNRIHVLRCVNANPYEDAIPSATVWKIRKNTTEKKHVQIKMWKRLGLQHYIKVSHIHRPRLYQCIGYKSNYKHYNHERNKTNTACVSKNTSQEKLKRHWSSVSSSSCVCTGVSSIRRPHIVCVIICILLSTCVFECSTGIWAVDSGSRYNIEPLDAFGKTTERVRKKKGPHQIYSDI